MTVYKIRDYVAQAQRDPTTENLEQLWRAVFLRQAWYFLPSRNDEGPARPMVSEIGGEPWLVAFTSARRLKAFAREAGRLNDDGTAPMLALNPAESMQKIRDVADSIAGVVFNIGSEATFRAPVEALQQYAEHFDVPVDGMDWG